MRRHCCFYLLIAIFHLTTFAVGSLLFSPELFAQSTTSLFGYVLDSEDSSPVSGAEVGIAGTSYEAVTDDHGKFTLYNIPPGVYSVEITASGYLRRVLQQTVAADINSRISIGLDKDIHIIEGITIVGRRILSYGGRTTVIGSEEIARIHPRNVADILQAVEGVYIERAGLDGGQTQVRIRGSAAKHVLVLIDGHKINPSGSGVADLNTVPVEIVEQVEIHKGGASAEFGPDALGGVINIVTQQTTLSDLTSIEGETMQGRWHTRSHAVTAVNPIHLRNMATKFAFSARESEGDFDYSYSVAPGNETYSDVRINNHARAANYFASGIWKPDESGAVRYSAHVYQSRNGLPGRASSQNPYAYREDDRVLANLHLERTIRSNLAAELRFGFSRFEQFFCDREAPPLQQYETRFTNDIFDARLGFRSALWKQNQLDWGMEFRSDYLDHADILRPRYSVGRTERRTYSAFFSSRQGADISRLLLFERASVDLALRYDRATTMPADTSAVLPWESNRHEHQVEHWSPGMGVTLSRGDRLRFIVRGSCGRSFRLPSINALFWKGDARSKGNPDLRPERSTDTEGGFEIGADAQWCTLSGGITFFHNSVTDLVVWTQGYQSTWSPVNLGSARITGHEDFITTSLCGDLFRVTYRNSITNALNKVSGHNSYDMYLTYTPRYVTTLTMRVAYRALFASYTIRQVGRRYALENNEKWYEAYRLDDITGGMSVNLSKKWRILFDWRLFNACDEDYVLITHHPMPGREYSVGLKLSYGLKDVNK